MCYSQSVGIFETLRAAPNVTKYLVDALVSAAGAWTQATGGDGEEADFGFYYCCCHIVRTRGNCI